MVAGLRVNIWVSVLAMAGATAWLLIHHHDEDTADPAASPNLSAKG